MVQYMSPMQLVHNGSGHRHAAMSEFQMQIFDTQLKSQANKQAEVYREIN